jgi:ribokinase
MIGRRMDEASNVDGPRLDVCVVGSFMADVVVRAPRLPQRGETVIGSSCETFLGGKGFNQAIAAARAGAVTAMAGALGDDDHGQQFLRTLAAEGIDATGVHVIPDAGTGIAFPVVEDSGENAIIVVPRANHQLTTEHVDRLSGVLGRATVVLMQLELPVDVVVAAAASARRSGATVMLNPAPAIADAQRFGGLVDVLVPNESELRLLAGDGAVDMPKAAARLSAVTGAHSVVVTLGEQGVYVWTAGGDFSVPGHRVDAVDTVGAGDAFCGVLAARLAGGADFHEAVRHANAAGALSTTRAGAEPSMPSREAVELLLTATATTT